MRDDSKNKCAFFLIKFMSLRAFSINKFQSQEREKKLQGRECQLQHKSENKIFNSLSVPHQ